MIFETGDSVSITSEKNSNYSYKAIVLSRVIYDPNDFRPMIYVEKNSNKVMGMVKIGLGYHGIRSCRIVLTEKVINNNNNKTEEDEIR